MARPNYKNLVKLFEERGPREAEQFIREEFAAKTVRPSDFDFGRLFCECFGYGEFLACRNRDMLARDVMEAAGAVSTAAFTRITGVAISTALMDAYESPEFVFSKIIPTVDSSSLHGEKIPGISGIGDEAQVVPEGENYPLAGVTEDWLESPPGKKRGLIVPVTREAVFGDKTGILLDRCKTVGEALGLNKEKRAIDAVIDENRTDHRYKWRGNTIATYGDDSGNHNWDNLQASNALADWTDIEAALQLFVGLTDPSTGEPITMTANQVVVTPSLLFTARRIINATQITITTPGYATTGSPAAATIPNPASGFDILSSALLASRLATDTSWFIGDIRKAVRYFQNWPIQTREAPSNSHDEFHRDIIAQFRADERGAYFVVEPRALLKSTA